MVNIQAYGVPGVGKWATLSKTMGQLNQIFTDYIYIMSQLI